MKRDKVGFSISHESIYQYIYDNKRHGGKLYIFLRHKNKSYHKRGREYNTRGLLKNRVSIEDRSKIVERKSRVGDWEIDTIIGANHKGAIVTIVDRASKFTVIKRTPTKHADTVTMTILDLMLPIKQLTHTITSDNGKEFAFHEQISKALDTKFYFANPYHSWERGLNEHTNGLIREYIPKQTDFSTLDESFIVEVQNKLNNRPRKSLNYQTPAEVFYATIHKQLAYKLGE